MNLLIGLDWIDSDRISLLSIYPKPVSALFGVIPKVTNFPLSAYSELSFYTMKTDAYDRFCTRLEKRYSRLKILSMMENAGLQKIKFSNKEPFWCAVGIKK